jgi:hypothetical protein
MSPRHYYYHRPRSRNRGNPRLEAIVSAAVIVLIVATVVIFLFVYHDFPLRVSGP